MFELAHPLVLWLIFLPLLIWYLLPRTKVAISSALKVPFFDAMEHIVDLEQPSYFEHSLLVLPTLIWMLLVIALAGPRWMGEPKPIAREGYNIMMVLDLSGSMDITDMIMHDQPVTRLSVVKEAAERFVQSRSGDKIGLILFGTRAYLQTPLTYDRRSVLQRIDDATSGLAGKTTSIGDALGLAVKRLESVPQQGRVIILLTDGANNSGVLAPLKAAELAKMDGIKVYTIGLGAESDPRLAQDLMNLNGAADLDEDTLTKIAEMTGGKYFRATDTQTLNSIYQTIHKLEKVKHEEATVRPQIEYYPWFSGFALLLSLWWLAPIAEFLATLRAYFSRKPELKIP